MGNETGTTGFLDWTTDVSPVTVQYVHWRVLMWQTTLSSFYASD